MPRRTGHPYFAGRPLLIAHRGGSALAPENTLTAFERAVEWWRADLLEIDVHVTADGEAVVIHDETVDRTTDGTGAVAGLTLDQVQRLDAGYRFGPDQGHPFRGTGITIPTLHDVLARFPATRVNVEVKGRRAGERVAEVVARQGAAGRVLIAAGTHRNRRGFEQYAGPVSASSREALSFWLHARYRVPWVAYRGIDAFQLPERHGSLSVITPDFVAAAHRHNLPVHVWTVDEEADMRRLLEWGVDGIITDHPDRLARVLHEVVGRPLPPGPPPG